MYPAHVKPPPPPSDPYLAYMEKLGFHVDKITPVEIHNKEN
jgi:hypothetical protein